MLLSLLSLVTLCLERKCVQVRTAHAVFMRCCAQAKNGMFSAWRTGNVPQSRLPEWGLLSAQRGRQQELFGPGACARAALQNCRTAIASQMESRLTM